MGDTNRHNTLYGGNLMRMMDNVSAISFTRHTRSLGITASMDVLNFIKPLPVSHSVCIETMISGVGKKSAEVFAKVIGENLTTGERYLDAMAFSLSPLWKRILNLSQLSRQKRMKIVM
ncbi:MAG TPA: hypothetical protein K8U70_05750 [Facklamia tabacinasalis]|nr:hypothetical protein [Ruoffia tabacinasalis]